MVRKNGLPSATPSNSDPRYSAVTINNTHIVIGASHAGVQATDSLRRAGFQGRIVLIGEEPHAPYQRPPLSKKFLLGELALERLVIRQAQFFEQHRIELHTGHRVTGIDTPSKSIVTGEGLRFDYDALILCVGARVRRITCPGADLPGIHYVRTLQDIDDLRPALQSGKRLVVIGAGYIGLETAASARSLGVEVTVLEMADRCLSRVTSPVVADFFARRHAEAGVRLFGGQRVAAILGDTRVREVVCEDGSSHPCDAVVVGVGIVPECELARAAGLACDNGIVVDERCRTSDPHIFAAGDCTNHPSIRYGGRGRLESVDNAVEQARVAASNICGVVATHAHTPWFWSDQYDIKLQTAGLLRGFDRHIVRGDPVSNHFSVWYFKEQDLLAVDAVNRPGDFIIGKRWIGERKRVAADKLADVGVELKGMG